MNRRKFPTTVVVCKYCGLPVERKGNKYKHKYGFYRKSCRRKYTEPTYITVCDLDEYKATFSWY